MSTVSMADPTLQPRGTYRKSIYKDFRGSHQIGSEVWKLCWYNTWHLKKRINCLHQKMASVDGARRMELTGVLMELTGWSSPEGRVSVDGARQC